MLGDAVTISIDHESAVDAYVASERARLVAAMRKKKEPSTPTTTGMSLGNGSAGILSQASVLSAISSAASAMTEPENRTEDEYLDSIDRWEARFRSAWKAALPKIAASQTQPVIVRITNRATTFFHDVEVRIHLEGGISAYDYTDPKLADNFSDLELPYPPRPWAPQQRSLDIQNYAALARNCLPVAGQYIPPSISYSNGGSVDLELDVGELRPRGTYESEDEEIVFVVADHSLTSIHGTWELTASDHNDVYTGEIEFTVDGDRQLTHAARRILGLGSDDASDREDQ
ncbi:hypothetical protein [Propionibacterium freudenreichii]|uniref:hypothetical protein n=1 Tax=Propionibacterium freudenreichii TaxID=1744 RepID=UPI0021A8C7E1|nr:hypothetical protein [Propionibacterium freudenreichii]